MTSSCRPKPADRDWPLYGDEYYRMKFGNAPIKKSRSLHFSEWRVDHFFSTKVKMDGLFGRAVVSRG
jgi:hypothetical protein